MIEYCYTIVQGIGSLELENAVNKYLANGWDLVGGVAVDNNGWYIQAMVLKEESGG